MFFSNSARFIIANLSKKKGFEDTILKERLPAYSDMKPIEKLVANC